MPVQGRLANGLLEIFDTPAGERMRLTLAGAIHLDEALVKIDRGAGTEEILRLQQSGKAGFHYQSDRAPAEPHEFNATLRLRRGQDAEEFKFRMVEPGGHPHSQGEHTH